MKNGERLKQQREKKGLTQAELAKRSDMSIRVLQNLEQGVRDINKTSVETVLRIADALGVDVHEILN